MTIIVPLFQTMNSTPEQVGDFLRAQRMADQEEYGFLKITNGFISPGFACIILPVNILLIVTFIRGRLHKPVHLTLAAIAIVETLSSIFNLIPSIYFYTLGYGEEYTPYAWCFSRDVLFRILPFLCRTWSLNLMVLLALQRVLVVKRPYHVNVYFTARKTIMFIVIAGVVAFLSNIPLILMLQTYSEIPVQSVFQPNKTIIGCTPKKVNIISIRVSDLLYNIFSRIIPVCLLIIFDACLLRTIKYTLRPKLFKLGMQTIQLNRRNSESNRLTLVIFTIICSILVVDIPAMSVHFYLVYAQGIPCRKCSLEKLFGVLYILDLLVYSSSFLIYCCLSKDFRRRISPCYNHFSGFPKNSFKLSLKPLSNPE